MQEPILKERNRTPMRILLGLYLVLGALLGSQYTAAASQKPAMDPKSFEARAETLESGWRATAKAAAGYFGGVSTLLREAGDAGIGLNDQTHAAARTALQKQLATVADGDRGALYKAQGAVAQWLLTAAPAAADEASFGRLRKQTAETAIAYLKVLTARRRAIATDKKPVTNVAPPPGTPGPVIAGMDPAAIKDPAARRAYEAAIAENDKLAATVREQSQLDAEIAALVQLAGRFIEGSYARPPARDQERSGLLRELDAAVK